MMHKPKNLIIIFSYSLLVISILLVALALLFIAAPAFAHTIASDGFWWFLFSFASGLIAVVLPCSLPIVFVVVPLALGSGGKRRPERALGMIFSFALGVMSVLSLYGGVVAYIGGVTMEFFDLKTEMLLNWMYYFAGIFAYVLALGEVGLVNVRMPSYAGIPPKFIQKQRDFFKMFLLGLFLGNIGVGFPNPAIPLLLLNAGASGSPVYGTLLFLVHGAGRVIPLIILTMLAALGWNGLRRLVNEKEGIERGSGWFMVFVSGYVLTLGLFTHSWLSGRHTLFSSLFGQGYSFSSGLERGILGQPLDLGNWFLVFLWVMPLWWFYLRERARVSGQGMLEVRKIEHKIDRLETERRGLMLTLHFPEGEQSERTRELLRKMDELEKERRILESGMRYGVHKGLKNEEHDRFERAALSLRRNWYLTITFLLVMFFIVTI